MVFNLVYPPKELAFSFIDFCYCLLHFFFIYFCSDFFFFFYKLRVCFFFNLIFEVSLGIKLVSLFDFSLVS